MFDISNVYGTVYKWFDCLNANISQTHQRFGLRKEKWFKEKLRDTRFDKKNESSFDKFD